MISIIRYIVYLYSISSELTARMKLKFTLKMYYNLCLRLHPVE